MSRSSTAPVLAGALCAFLLLVLVLGDVDYIPCNDLRCQSKVSFCLLTKDCMCDDFATNFTCANLCTKCLNETYQDCCSCVGLCEASVKEADINKLSNVEMLSDPDNDMFQLFSLAPERPTDWHAETLTLKLHIDMEPSSGLLPSADPLPLTEFNCTVVYLGQCMSMNKCKQNCESLGSSAFRWFHNACCECVGECDLAPYGNEEAKCQYCSETTKAKQEPMLSDETDEDGLQSDESYEEEEATAN